MKLEQIKNDNDNYLIAVDAVRSKSGQSALKKINYLKQIGISVEDVGEHWVTGSTAVGTIYRSGNRKFIVVRTARAFVRSTPHVQLVHLAELL